MRMYRRELAKAAALLALPAVIGVRRAQAATAVKFVVDFAFQGNHAVFALGIDHGHYSREGVTLTMDRGYGSGDTIVKVASGAYDIGFADVNAVVKFNAQNPDKRVVAVYQGFDRTLTAVITLQRSGLKVPSDLAGHTIGAPESDASRLLFPIFAQKNNIDAAKVAWKSIAPNLRETILVQGQVDAITGFTSTSLFNLVAAGVPQDQIVMMPFADFGLDLYGNAVIVREDFITAHPEIVAGFVRATIAGTKDTIKDPDAGMQAMKRRDPLFDATLERKRFDMVLKDAMLTPSVRKNGFGFVDPARMALTISANAQAFGITNPPTLEQVYTTKFLPPQAERMPDA
jgi:NitT/TauT family transport system substrate-binding protein